MRKDTFKVREFFKTLSYNFIAIDLFGLSAQIAYFLLFSLFPFLLFLLSIIPYFNIDTSVIADGLSMYLPYDVATFIMSFINDIFESKSFTLLSIGLLTTIYSASSAINSIMNVLDNLYNGQTTRNFLRTRIYSILITVVFQIILILSLIVATIDNTVIQSVFGTLILIIITLLKWLIIPVALFLLLAVIFTVGPHRKSKLRESAPGAIFSTFGFFLSTVVYQAYVSSIGQYSIKYGFIGYIIVLMFWLYIIGAVILIGGLINSTIYHVYFKNETLEDQLNKKQIK